MAFSPGRDACVPVCTAIKCARRGSKFTTAIWRFSSCIAPCNRFVSFRFVGCSGDRVHERPAKRKGKVGEVLTAVKETRQQCWGLGATTTALYTACHGAVLSFSWRTTPTEVTSL